MTNHLTYHNVVDEAVGAAAGNRSLSGEVAGICLGASYVVGGGHQDGVGVPAGAGRELDPDRVLVGLRLHREHAG